MHIKQYPAFTLTHFYSTRMSIVYADIQQDKKQAFFIHLEGSHVAFDMR